MIGTRRLSVFVGFLLTLNVAQAAYAQYDPNCFKCCGWGAETYATIGHRDCVYYEHGCHVTECPEPGPGGASCCSGNGDRFNDTCAPNTTNPWYDCDSFYFHFCEE
jgi:hypothetical protein